MKKVTPTMNSFWISIVAILFSYSVFAATESTDIDISHTYTPFVNLTGTAPGASKFYDNSDVINFIFPVMMNIGTMGLESNVGGNCDLNFTTQNNFELIHTVNSNFSFGDYTIQFRGETFNQANNPQIELPCTSSATDLNFIMNGLSLGGIDYFVQSGVYQDVINVVVTTQ